MIPIYRSRGIKPVFGGDGAKRLLDEVRAPPGEGAGAESDTGEGHGGQHEAPVSTQTSEILL